MSRFVATFLPENQSRVKIYKIEFSKIALAVASILETKSGLTVESWDIRRVLEMLGYTTAFTDDYDSKTRCKKMFLNVDPLKVEDLILLVKYLEGNFQPTYADRIKELDLQVNIFNKLNTI